MPLLSTFSSASSRGFGTFKTSGGGYGTAPPALYTSGAATSSRTASVALPSFTAPNKSVIVIINGTESLGYYLSSVSWGGLSFARRTSGASSSEVMDIWWAYNQTGADITTTGTVSWGGTTDDQALVYAVFTGCNQTNPWASTATINSGNGALTVSWSRPNVYALVACGAWQTPAQGYPAGTGLSSINSALNGGATYYEYVYLSGGAQSAASGSITATFGSTTVVQYADFLAA